MCVYTFYNAINGIIKSVNTHVFRHITCIAYYYYSQIKSM